MPKGDKIYVRFFYTNWDDMTTDPHYEGTWGKELDCIYDTQLQYPGFQWESPNKEYESLTVKHTAKLGAKRLVITEEVMR
jgi:hypothetical protein